MNEMFVLCNKTTRQKIIVVLQKQHTEAELCERVALRHAMQANDLEIQSIWYYPFQISGEFHSFITR